MTKPERRAAGTGKRPPPELVEAAIAAARDAARPVAELPIETIAARAGISRATLFRRIGSKQALLDGVAAAGVDPGGRPSVRQRAITSAAHLIAEEGLGALTMDVLATRADCAPATLYRTFGSRDELIHAVFEAFSPLPAIANELPDAPSSLEDALQAIVRAVLRCAWRPAPPPSRPRSWAPRRSCPSHRP
ncbi:MAG: TetR family transcriptional regulator [Deinococcales bacterium]